MLNFKIFSDGSGFFPITKHFVASYNVSFEHFVASYNVFLFIKRTKANSCYTRAMHTHKRVHELSCPSIGKRLLRDPEKMQGRKCDYGPFVYSENERRSDE